MLDGRAYGVLGHCSRQNGGLSNVHHFKPKQYDVISGLNEEYLSCTHRVAVQLHTQSGSTAASTNLIGDGPDHLLSFLTSYTTV